MFVDPHYGICFISLSWHLESSGGSQIPGEFTHLYVDIFAVHSLNFTISAKNNLWAKQASELKRRVLQRRSSWNTSIFLVHYSIYPSRWNPKSSQLITDSASFPVCSCVYKQMLRWFPRFQVATTCFSCSPPDLNLLVTNFIFCIHVK